MLPGIGLGEGASATVTGGQATSGNEIKGGDQSLGGFNFNIGGPGFSLARLVAGVDPFVLWLGVGVVVLVAMLWLKTR